MEFYVNFLVLVVYFQSLLHSHSLLVKADPFCGNASTTDACKRTCYDGCMDRVSKEDLTDQNIKEDIATQTNLCVNKCFGNEFIPLISADVPKLPSYLDALSCLGRCAYPAHTEHCLTGYLSNFFYCDCHQCCLQSPNNKKCVHGCHIWFLRQWSPKPGQGCRFRPEYANSPRTWCTQFCIHKVLTRDPSLSWNDIPQIRTTSAAHCIRRCSSLILSGIPVDYDVESDSCTDITKCITATVVEFNAYTTYYMDTNYLQPYLRSKVPMNNEREIPISNRQPFAAQMLFNRTVRIVNEFDIRRSPALDSMHSMGIEVVSGLGVDEQTIIPRRTFHVFPWGNVGLALATAYNYSSDPRKILGLPGSYFGSARWFEIGQCTSFTPGAFVDCAEGVRFEHEVFVKIADTKTLFPLTAAQVRNAVSQKLQWRELEFVTNFDNNAIVMKGKGYGFVKFGFEIAYDDTCGKAPNCNYPNNPSTPNCKYLARRSVNSYDYGGTVSVPPIYAQQRM